MRAPRIRPGEVLAAAAGLVLLASLWLPWFEPPGGPKLSGWTALHVTDVVLAIAAVAAIGAAVVTAASAKPDAPIVWEAIAALPAFIAVLLAVRRLLDPPGGLERCAGVYVGAAASIAVLAGLWLALRDERPRGG